MRRPARIAVAVLAAGAVGVGGFAVFEAFERRELAAKADARCTEVTAASASELPFDLPLSEDEKVLRVQTQGATTAAFATLPGGRDDIVSVRDAVLEDLKRVGYRVDGTDQEPGFEAEAELSGPHTGTLKVSPLCTGLLEIRYKIES